MSIRLTDQQRLSPQALAAIEAEIQRARRAGTFTTTTTDVPAPERASSAPRQPSWGNAVKASLLFTFHWISLLLMAGVAENDLAHSWVIDWFQICAEAEVLMVQALNRRYVKSALR